MHIHYYQLLSTAFPDKFNQSSIQKPVLHHRVIQYNEEMVFPCKFLQATINTSLSNLWFCGRLIYQVGSMLVTRILNQTTRGQTLCWSIHWRLTSLLVSHCRNWNSSLLLSVDACERYSFLCNASRHFEESHLVVKMQTSHYQSEHSCRSGLGPITFLQAKHARVL